MNALCWTSGAQLELKISVKQCTEIHLRLFFCSWMFARWRYTNGSLFSEEWVRINFFKYFIKNRYQRTISPWLSSPIMALLLSNPLFSDWISFSNMNLSNSIFSTRCEKFVLMKPWSLTTAFVYNFELILVFLKLYYPFSITLMYLRSIFTYSMWLSNFLMFLTGLLNLFSRICLNLKIVASWKTKASMKM